MIAKLMALSVRARWTVAVIVLLIGAFGAWQLSRPRP